MSNPGSRSNDDKLLAKIKDLEAKVEDLKRHTHPDRARGKPTPAAGSLGLFVCADQASISSGTSHTALDLVDSGVGVGGHASVVSGKIRFATAGVYEILAMCQASESGGTETGDWEFVVSGWSGAPTFYGPMEARGEWVDGNGGSLCVITAVEVAANDEIYASAQVVTSNANITQVHALVTVKGPF